MRVLVFIAILAAPAAARADCKPFAPCFDADFDLDIHFGPEFAGAILVLSVDTGFVALDLLTTPPRGARIAEAVITLPQVAYGAYRLIDGEDREAWAAFTIATGVLAVHGLYGAFRSERVSIAPAPGGVLVAGRF